MPGPDAADGLTGTGSDGSFRISLRLRIAACSFGTAAVSAILVHAFAGAEVHPALAILASLAAAFAMAMALAGPVAAPTTRDLLDLQTAIERAVTTGEPLVPDAPATPEVAAISVSLGRLEFAMRTRSARVDEELRRLETGFTLTSTGLIALDNAGRIAHLNPAAMQLLQLDQAAVGAELLRAVHDAEIFAMLERCLAGGELQTQLIEYGSRRQYLQVSMIPLTGAGEWAAFAVFTDLTEVRRLETMRREFVSNVSHELRTPLASIKAVVETLESGALEDRSVALDFLQRVNQEVDRLTSLVEELLEISRLEGGSRPLELTRREPVALLQEAARRMAPQAQRGGVTLAVHDRVPVPDIQVDAERLERAIVNLVHNALKFTPAGGSIRLWADSAAGTVSLHVADDGFGIAEEDQERVFERFFKADKARSSGGSGLGLAIVKHVAQAHHGSVAVTSTEGEGSEFVITLPVAT